MRELHSEAVIRQPSTSAMMALVRREPEPLLFRVRRWYSPYRKHRQTQKPHGEYWTKEPYPVKSYGTEYDKGLWKNR